MGISFRHAGSSFTLPSCSGDGTEPVFEYDEKGELVCTGRTDVQALIQSHKEECDIGYLLSRALNGDSTALSQRVGQYIDTVDMPDSLIDAFRRGQAGSKAYASLTDLQKKILDEHGITEEFVQSFVDSKQAAEDLIARLKSLTGKEVHIDE